MIRDAINCTLFVAICLPAIVAIKVAGIIGGREFRENLHFEYAHFLLSSARKK